MDRSVLEGDPHRVLEGMAIAAYAVGASEGYVYVRAEYPLAIKRLKNAIKQAERAGVLGKNIFGTTFSFTVEIRIGAGAFVCGEETALIASIEGKRERQPRPRPPYPAQVGLWGAPTLINNVETFRQYCTYNAQRRRVVCIYWYRKEQGHKSICACQDKSVTQVLLKYQWVQSCAM